MQKDITPAKLYEQALKNAKQVQKEADKIPYIPSSVNLIIPPQGSVQTPAQRGQ